jgi:hypothetical protein
MNARAIVMSTVIATEARPSCETLSSTPKGAVPISSAAPMQAATTMASIDLRPSVDQ